MIHRNCFSSISRAHVRTLFLCFSLFALIFSPLAEARRNAQHAQPDQQQAAAQDQPGVFDYYLLTLSWSPQYCSGHPGDKVQCGTEGHHGFVVHGLWPQFNSGYPQSCSTEQMGQGLADNYLDIMPSPKLIQHEWEKHGTCSGLQPQQYFDTIRSVFSSIAVPDQYKLPSKPLSVKLKQFKEDVAAANPGLDAKDFAVACTGKYLDEVRICYDKNLKPQACGHDVRDSCKAPTIILRPAK
jgi:ribonuclease T2